VRIPSFCLAACSCALGLAITELAAASLDLKTDWWRGPACRTRHTTLAASFDSAESNEADYARDLAASGGFGMRADVPGKHGAGTQVAETGGHLNFVGRSNFQAAHGTLRMWVKGDVWADKTPRWLFEARGYDRIGLRREPGKLSLVVSSRRSTKKVISQLDLRIGEVSTREWHSVVASWDREVGMGWIVLDGKGVSGKMEFSQDWRPAFALYLAGGFGGRTGGLNLAGLTIDDFVLYDVPILVLEAELASLSQEDQELLMRAEAGARKTLNFLADIQRWGGWQCIYTWPTLIGSSAQGREHVTFGDYIDNDKGNATPRVAGRFLYAYQVMGDYRFLDVALRAAEFLLAAQDEKGFWVHGYRMTVHGIQPAASERHIKLQDCVQAHPMYYLCAMYRLTGYERYLAAVKKAGEFYLAAQNPNGSWSHHFDAEAGIGKTARNHPQGGELNDRAMNDAIDCMALMYHLTKDARYVKAIKRAGDWLIEAQGKHVPLWADQYDAGNNPVEARHFEPAAFGPRATGLAVQALREVYRFSGDERYLQPIRKALEWIEANCPKGNMASYIHCENGRPIASWKRKIHYLDEAESLAYLKTVPTGSSYLRQSSILGSVKKALAGAVGAKPVPPQATPESAKERLPILRESVQHALDTQNSAGVWVSPKFANFMGSLGAGFINHCPRVRVLLSYAESARIAMGELEPAYRGNGALKSMAYPMGDWYELNWLGSAE